MKTNIARLTLIAGLSVAGTTTALAHEDYTEAGSNHWIAHVAETKSQPAANQLAPHGYATSGPASRVVNLDSGAKYLNATRLETIQINFAGKSVTWTFDTLGTAPFPLSKIIPGAEGVMVYIDENPMYQGG